MAKKLTLAEIAGMDKLNLTPEEAAGVLGCDPHKIRVMAASQQGRADLGFPVIRMGQITKIPRVPFLRVLGWEGEVKGATA